MNLHDAVFAVGSVVNAAAMVPAVRARARMPRTTTLPTAVVLTAFAANFATMSFWWTAAVTGATAVLWWALVVIGPQPGPALSRSAGLVEL